MGLVGEADGDMSSPQRQLWVKELTSKQAREGR